MSHWYAIQTKARQESMARDHLERQGFNIYLPMFRSVKRRRERWQTVVEPLFPGYLFAQLDIESQDIGPIRSTRGVVGLVRFGMQLLPVPQLFVDALIDGQPDGDAPVDLQAVFKGGDDVTIVDGPLAGMKAIFESVSGQERVCLLLDLMGRQNRVTVDARQIIPTT